MSYREWIDGIKYCCQTDIYKMMLRLQSVGHIGKSNGYLRAISPWMKKMTGVEEYRLHLLVYPDDVYVALNPGLVALAETWNGLYVVKVTYK